MVLYFLLLLLLLHSPCARRGGEVHDDLQKIALTAFPAQYSVPNLAHSYNDPGPPHHPGGRNDYHNDDPFSHTLYPEDHRDDYDADPYRPNVPGGAGSESYPLTQYPPGGNDPYDDYEDHHRPILPPVDTSGTPFSVASGENYQVQPSISPVPISDAGTPAPGLSRWKTVKKVALFKGNLVLDCPVPNMLLNQLPMKTEREFTHMRWVLSGTLGEAFNWIERKFGGGAGRRAEMLMVVRSGVIGILRPRAILRISSRKSLRSASSSSRSPVIRSCLLS